LPKATRLDDTSRRTGLIAQLNPANPIKIYQSNYKGPLEAPRVMNQSEPNIPEDRPSSRLSFKDTLSRMKETSSPENKDAAMRLSAQRAAEVTKKIKDVFSRGT
jgi:hypothetical protein